MLEDALMTVKKSSHLNNIFERKNEEDTKISE